MNKNKFINSSCKHDFTFQQRRKIWYRCNKTPFSVFTSHFAAPWKTINTDLNDMWHVQIFIFFKHITEEIIYIVFILSSKPKFWCPPLHLIQTSSMLTSGHNLWSSSDSSQNFLSVYIVTIYKRITFHKVASRRKNT